MTEPQIHERISKLLSNLKATDYKIIKCYEASLLDEPLPYDIILLKQERDSWRSEISDLKAQLLNLTI